MLDKVKGEVWYDGDGNLFYYTLFPSCFIYATWQVGFNWHFLRIGIDKLIILLY